MKTFNQFLLILLIYLSLCVTSSSQTLFVENFNYPVRDSLEEIGGWSRSGLNSANNIKIISPGLVYSGYLGSGIGNTTSMNNFTNGDICFHSFNLQNSGNLYMSFLIRVDSLSSTANEGYNISFNPYSSTNLNTKPYIKKLTSATFNFGIQKLEGTVKYSTTVYSINVTYLVVVKCIFVAGSSNDSCKIFVFSTGVPSTEPSIPAAFDTEGTDVPDNTSVVLTNSYAQNGLNKSSVKIDGIRIGKIWTSTLLTPVNLQLKLTALIQGFYNDVTNKMVKDTARVYLRNNSAPYSIADSSIAVIDSTGKGTFLFAKIGNYTPYYITVKHRNSIETWSWGGINFVSDSLNFDFTAGSYQAYGNNLILKGTRYCFFSGDENQDGAVNLTDVVNIYNNSVSFVNGYVRTDVNGDNVTNLTDVLIAYNNSLSFVQLLRP